MCCVISVREKTYVQLWFQLPFCCDIQIHNGKTYQVTCVATYELTQCPSDSKNTKVTAI